jgi:Protein of unknown function (DUF3105)
MANRREEERERLRQAREEKEKSHTSSERKRLFLAYGAAGLIGLIVVGAAIVAIVSSGGGDGGESAHINVESGSTNGISPDDRTGVKPVGVEELDVEQAAKQAGCVLRLKLKDEGHTHIPAGSEAPEYKTNPPTSGNHVEPPYQQADGAYTEMPLPIDMVHSLEHGRMEIQYSPDLSEDAQLELKGLYETMYGGVLLFPNQEMPFEVAATTWTNLLGCEKYEGKKTLDAIAAFGKATWGRYGGEPVRAFTFTGPTPKKPES